MMSTIEGILYKYMYSIYTIIIISKISLYMAIYTLGTGVVVPVDDVVD